MHCIRLKFNPTSATRNSKRYPVSGHIITCNSHPHDRPLHYQKKPAVVLARDSDPSLFLFLLSDARLFEFHARSTPCFLPEYSIVLYEMSFAFHFSQTLLFVWISLAEGFRNIRWDCVFSTSVRVKHGVDLFDSFRKILSLFFRTKKKLYLSEIDFFHAVGKSSNFKLDH